MKNLDRIAEIIIPEGVDRKGHATKIKTAYGAKTRAGIADMIEQESGIAELLESLRELLLQAEIDATVFPKREQARRNTSLAKARAAIAKATA